MRADRSPPELQPCIARSFEHELYLTLRGGRSGTIKFASHHYRCQDLVLFRLELPARKLDQVLPHPELRNRMDTQSDVRLLGRNCKANTRRLLAGASVCSGQPAGLANYPQPLEPCHSLWSVTELTRHPPAGTPPAAVAVELDGEQSSPDTYTLTTALPAVIGPAEETSPDTHTHFSG